MLRSVASLPRPHLGMRTGSFYYGPATGLLGTSTAVASANTFYAAPYWLAGSTINRLVVEVTTFAAATNARLGIFANVNGLPSTTLVDGGTVSTGSNAIVEATITDFVAPYDWIWLGAVFEGTPTMRRVSTGDSELIGFSSTTGTAVTGLSQSLSYAAFPAALSSAGWSYLSGPTVWARRA